MPIFATHKVLLILQLGELITFWRTPPHRFIFGWIMFLPVLISSVLINKNARLVFILELLASMEDEGSYDLCPQWSQRIVDRTVDRYLAAGGRKHGL